MTEQKKLTSEQEKNARRWMLKHARIIKCPPCTGQPRPNKNDFSSSTVRCPCICPVCHKTWQYITQIEKKVSERRPTWHYHKLQLFDDKNDKKLLR